RPSRNSRLPHRAKLFFPKAVLAGRPAARYSTPPPNTAAAAIPAPISAPPFPAEKSFFAKRRLTLARLQSNLTVTRKSILVFREMSIQALKGDCCHERDPPPVPRGPPDPPCGHLPHPQLLPALCRRGGEPHRRFLPGVLPRRGVGVPLF